MVEFIKIKHSLNEALAYNASGQEDRATYEFGGVQLLPNSIYPYIQRTHDPAGIEIEDWQVWVCDTCGNEIEEITDYFDVTRVFQDLNGKPQIEWSLLNVPFDFAYNLVLLKIQQGFNEFFYTTPFYLTNDGAELTSRWDYQEDFNETMLSTQFQVYFRDYDSALNIASYNQIKDGKRKAQNVTNTEFELWKTQNVDKYFFKQFRNIFTCRIIYVDFLRAGIYDNFESPKIEFDQNFKESEFLITRDEADTYDPNYIAPTPPTPPVTDKEIVLVEALSVDSNTVALGFYFVNFSPSYLIAQYSDDNVTWSPGVLISNTSPQSIIVPNNITTEYYYRVYNGDIISNSVQVLPAEIMITNIDAEPGVYINSGNDYIIEYTIQGYTPSVYFLFEGSRNGTTWINMLYEQGNENPKTVKAPAGGLLSPSFRYFRIRDTSRELISNIYEHEF